MKTDSICCYFISNSGTKRSIAESLHGSTCIHKYCRLTACKVGILIFLREISQLLKIHPSSFFEELLKFITHGHIFERLQYKYTEFIITN